MRSMLATLSIAFAISLAILAPSRSCAAGLTTLVTFNRTDGMVPVADLIADAHGNLFGTTEYGGANGANGNGTVFEIAKTAGRYASIPSVLYSFCAQTNCTDGSFPTAGLIANASGNLFGTTSGGGAHGQGTVFEIVKTGGGYASIPAVLYSFCAQTNCTDGAYPTARLIADASGNLFGTTQYGGASPYGGVNPCGSGPPGCGTVFEFARTARGYAATPTILYSFCVQAHCTDGANPRAGLLADASGNLLGTTFTGGANMYGTVFEIAKTAGRYASIPSVLYSFCAQTNCTDGSLPTAGLIADASGNLFGTTSAGGAFSCVGSSTGGVRHCLRDRQDFWRLRHDPRHPG